MTMDGDVGSNMVGGPQTAGDIEAEEKKREYSLKFCVLLVSLAIRFYNENCKNDFVDQGMIFGTFRPHFGKI